MSSPPRFRRGDQPQDIAEVKAFAEQKRGSNVKVEAVVTKAGDIAEAKIVESSGLPDLDAKVLGMVSEWKLAAGRKDGEAVHSLAKFPFFLGHFPERLEGKEPVLTDEAKALGHHGKVLIVGDISPDGSVQNARVATSSRSDLVDALALETVKAYKYEPPVALDGSANTIPNAGFRFDLMQAKEDGGSYVTGLDSYKCGAFIREYDWYNQTFTSENDKFELRSFMIGAQMIIGGGLSDPKKFKSGMSQFDSFWDKTVEQCRQKPDKLFRDVFRKAK